MNTKQAAALETLKAGNFETVPFVTEVELQDGTVYVTKTLSKTGLNLSTLKALRDKGLIDFFNRYSGGALVDLQIK